MATSKKTGTTKRGTKSTKKAATAPKTGRAKVAKAKGVKATEAWRSKAAMKAWQTRRTNAMHANNPG